MDDLLRFLTTLTEWYSTIHGSFARFHCTGNNCRFLDFAILSTTTLRDDNTPDNAFNGGAGRGSRVERVWVEHTKVGWWVGAGKQNVTDGLVISGSRFRDLFADGVNFCNGTSNSVVENSHFRNTGDDALAWWAPSFDEIDSPTFAGLQIEGPFALSGATFSGVRISSPGTSGIYLLNASGGATFSAVTVSSPANKGLEDASGTSFKIVREAGNSGW